MVFSWFTESTTPTSPGSAPRRAWIRAGWAGEALPVGDYRAQGLAPAVGAHVEVADEAGVGPLVIGRDLVLLHPGPEGPPQPGGGQGLEEAVRGVDDVVAPGAEKAHPGAGGHGELDLVPVPVGLGRPVDDRDLPRPAADALEGVLDLLFLEGQLLGIGHVPQLAPPALGIVGAVGDLPAGGGLQDLLHPAPGGAFAHL